MQIGGRPVAWICRAAIVLAIVGVFGTWRNAGPVSLDGLEGPHNGWLVIIFALIALAGVGAIARGSWLGIVTVLGSAAVMLSTAVHDLVDDDAVVGGSSGWGVWLTIAASAVLAAVAVCAAVWRSAAASGSTSRLEEVGELVPEPALEPGAEAGGRRARVRVGDVRAEDALLEERSRRWGCAPSSRPRSFGRAPRRRS